ncbi:hypothetical protein H6H01_33740 [Nostoc calcicola FACHB-3891]|nr:hypothetical protein [Nostoc calcicola FACHB-3891]
MSQFFAREMHSIGSQNGSNGLLVVTKVRNEVLNFLTLSIQNLIVAL